MASLQVQRSETNGQPGQDTHALAHARKVTEAAHSSFYWAMRLLPRAQRQAMFAVYAFCREVDDIADGTLPTAEKLARLDQWREEIARVYHATPELLTARALVQPVASFGLPQDEFLAVIDGMVMDAAGDMVAPDHATLELYCRRVASAVGLLSIRVFGATEPAAADFALALGKALQLTNILRDLWEDAAMGRLYLPREALIRHGIETGEPTTVLCHPRLDRVCAEVAELAARRFDEAEEALAQCRRSRLRPAIVMMANYRRVLDRLIDRGWQRLDQRVQVSKPEKLWIALRYGML